MTAPSLLGLLLLVSLIGSCGLLLGWMHRRFGAGEDGLVQQIDALLPQTQCGQCGYPGCRPYAEAVEQGEAINKCPPGGDTTITELAALLGRDPVPLDGEATSTTMVAFIREDECIGCTKCIQACPVDAIIGASKLMHTVIADECTGCDLCVAPCPVDCIDLLERPPAMGESIRLIASDRPSGEHHVNA
ncbi:MULTISPECIES: electron transport complex subunit RsxB [Halomonas]|uniref:electron transport complex subunit RsxB n=1 Tax=Halomonas TaxID=2745 RepID=UPI001C970EF8|nr:MULTISPECIES: electron transport complex subunit RsxB [Halomonas]MBY5969808.1 electron transport complex subunit RsxB [Halomonas denitrificans]MBY6207089.1 electron transport complex subunit RsxB [Halomonas sp. DP3Y7-2]MBY6229683.1 electron transport complex subunit RsxB [Halomonas sp. DP3Y7-1]MCA0917985.1 electron transport complex subunit RsxB [Halomonas denitrificans]